MLKKIKEFLANWLFKKELEGLKNNYSKSEDLLVKARKNLLDSETIKKQYTVLEPYNCDDIQYLRRLHEIITDDKFLFHLYVIKSEMVSKITSGNEKDAVYYQGMLKGLNEVFEKTLNASRAYKQLSQAQEEVNNNEV